jgi:nitrogen regulatory protein P-II 2
MLNLTTLKRVTIVAERVLESELIHLLRETGAKGYTLIDARGEGSRGVRASEWAGSNIKIEVVVSAEVADALLNSISERYFKHYAVIAYMTEVQVVRGHKYT